MSNCIKPPTNVFACDIKPPADAALHLYHTIVHQTGDKRERAPVSPHSTIDSLRLHIAGQLHAHEDPTGQERHHNKYEAHGRQQNAIELRLAGRMVGLVHNDEAQSADGEQEGAGQALHDVLPVDAVRQEGDLCKRC